jgi:tetratricopeptide (TPR) repeat protein
MGSMGGSALPSRTPAQVANGAYKSGQKYKKRAVKHEQKAAAASDPEKRDKYLEKARKQYKKSVDEYLKAYNYNRSFHEALNELGYAYRKIGEYDNAIRAYNTALNVKPDYAQAIEYRGEAYLALGMFEKTQKAYMTLFRTDQDQAALLMAAMESWMENETRAAGPDADAFIAWIEERRALAAGTQTLSLNNHRDW